MFRAIEDQHIPTDRLGSNQVRILGHVARPVDLAVMVDLLDDLDARCGGDGVPAQLPALVVIRVAIELVRVGASALGDLDCGYLEVVLRLAGGVRAEEEAVGSVWFIRWAG